MLALLWLYGHDCSSAVVITWAQPRSDGRGEELRGEMTQGCDDASLGPDFLIAGSRNIPPKSRRLGRGVIYHRVASLHSLCLARAPFPTAKVSRKSMRPFVFTVFVGIWWFSAWLEDLRWCRAKLRTCLHDILFMMNSLSVGLWELLLQIGFISFHVPLTKNRNFVLHPNLL